MNAQIIIDIDEILNPHRNSAQTLRKSARKICDMLIVDFYSAKIGSDAERVEPDVRNILSSIN